MNRVLMGNNKKLTYFKTTREKFFTFSILYSYLIATFVLLLSYLEFEELSQSMEKSSKVSIGK